jgi:hypothetical protein
VKHGVREKRLGEIPRVARNDGWDFLSAKILVEA